MWAWHWIGSLAFEPETKMGLSQVAHLVWFMCACAAWLRRLHKTKHLSLREPCWYHNQLWLSKWGHFALCLGNRTGNPSADRGIVPAQCRGSRLTAVVQAYQDLAHPHFRRRWEVGSLHQYSVHPVLVPSRLTPENDSQSWAPCKNVYAVNLMRHQGRVSVWTAVTQHQHHCISVLQTPGLSGRSGATPEHVHSLIRFLNDQVRPRIPNITHQKLLSWSGKCSSTHPIPQALCPPTIICPRPWDMPVMPYLLQRRWPD